MDPCVVVSPHLDDAVLSAGQFLAQWDGAFVLTVMAGVPPTGLPLTSYDGNCGFDSGKKAVAKRRKEDDVALAALGSTPLRLGFLDHQYRPGQAADIEGIAVEVEASLVRTGARRLIFPLGLEHPDHRAVCDACLRVVMADETLDAFVYEELPHRVLWPEAVNARMAALADDGWKLALEFIGAGAWETKRRAISAYASQLWALDPHCLFVPERFHRVTR